jgi:hypothetical protein
MHWRLRSHRAPSWLAVFQPSRIRQSKGPHSGPHILPLFCRARRERTRLLQVSSSQLWVFEVCGDQSR